jgi:Protein of unknown function (DUF2004)
MSYQLPYFGAVDPEELDEYYDVETELGAQKLTLDLNFDEGSIAIKKMDLLRMRLETLPALLEQARDAVRESFRQGQEAREYIDQHIDLIAAPVLQKGLQEADATLSDEQKLFSLVSPVRIGLYPEDEESYFVLDFSLGRELTDHLIVVVMSVDEKLREVTRES